MNLKIQLLCQILITQLVASTIYPVSQSNTVQWENQIWSDCQTLELIEPINCSNNDQKWEECYEIPKNGLCLSNQIVGEANQTYICQLIFYNDVPDNLDIKINDEEQTYTKISNKKIILNTTQTEIMIKINTPSLLLQNLIISTSCGENCKQCSSDYSCQECQDSYSLINYQCANDDCFNTLGTISAKSVLNSQAIIDSNSNYQVSVTFNVELGQCLIPKVYILKQINSNQIEYVLPKNQITLSKQSKILFTLTLKQLSDHCQLLFADTQKKVYQCLLSVALTFQKLTQFTTLLIGQIEFNLQTSNIITTTQIMSLPDTGTVSYNVASNINQVIVNDNTITLIQTIYQSNLKNQTQIIESAYMKQNGLPYYNLELVQMIKNESNTSFKFKILDSQIKLDQQIDLIITTRFQQSSRLLSTDRSGLSILYKTNNLYNFQSYELQSTTSNSTKEESEICIIGFTIFFLIASIIGLIGSYFFLKKEKQLQLIGNEDRNQVIKQK